MRRNKANTVGVPVILAVLILAAIIVGWTFSGSAGMAKTAPDFVSEASIGNQFEIESSQLALQKSQNNEVKQFAQRMIDDHTKAGQDLNSALAAAPEARAEANGQLDKKHQDLLDELNKASGSDFDKKYVKDQVKAHDDTVDLFKNYAGNGDNATLKNFAARTLPTLQSHQHDIHQIHSSL